MINTLSYKISDLFINNGKIELEKREVIAYGLGRIFTNIILLVSFTAIGCLLNDIKGISLFLLFFIPLRKYAGGFHFESSIFCYVVSCFVVTIAVLVTKIIYSLNIYLMIGFVSMLLIWKMAPIQARRKVLTKEEKIVYGGNIKIILVVDIMIVSILLLLRIDIIYPYILISFLVESILLIIGKIKDNQ